MAKKITTVALSRIPKLEFPELINSVVEIVDKYDSAIYHIEGSHNLLLEVQPQLSNLEVVYTKSAETVELASLRNKRKYLLMAILNQSKAMKNTSISALSAQVKLVQPFVEKYFRGIIADNTRKRSERINQMFVSMEADVTLKAALSTVGLLVYMDELKTVQQALESKHSTRRASKSARVRMRTKEVKTSLAEALTDLLASIELARKQYSNVDYMPMVNEINELFVSFQSQMKAQRTRRKNIALAIEAAKIAGSTPTSDAA